MASPSSYAVLELNDQQKAADLFNLLLSNGYTYVTFLPQLQDHPAMRSFIEERDRTMKCKGECQQAVADIVQKDSDSEPKVEQVSREASVEPAQEAQFQWNEVGEDVKPAVNFGEDDSEDGEEAMESSNNSDWNNDNVKRDEPQEDELNSLDQRVRVILNGASSSAAIPPSTFELGKPAHNMTRYKLIPVPPNLVINADYAPNRPLFVRAPNDLSNLSCTMCRRDLQSASLPQLAEHAKTHCLERQFTCVEEGCPYYDKHSYRVRRHMKSKHDIDGEPNEQPMTDNGIAEAWLEIFRTCFPPLKDDTEISKLILSQIAPKRPTKSTKSVQPVEIQIPGTQQCMVCLKMVFVAQNYAKGSKGIGYLVRHSKSHCDRQQFVCIVTGCGYSHKRDRYAVKEHMLNVHSIDENPKDMMSPELEKAWIDTFNICFPTLQKKIANYAFRKRGRRSLYPRDPPLKQAST